MAKSVTTLGDVAEAAGVSKSTVSRILNNKIGNGFSVKQDIRKRVLDAAKKLNYKPNLIAKSLILQKSRMIHIVGGHHALSDLGNIYQTVVNSATRILESSEQVFDVTVDMSSHKADSSELPAWKIDGVIILAKTNSVTFKELEQNHIPYVVVNGPAGYSGISVVPDDIGGMKQAIEYLYDNGHRKIAYANAPPVHLFKHKSIIDRQQSYIDTMIKLGLKPIKGFDQWLDAPDKFLQENVLKDNITAIVAYGHMGGLNLLQASHKLNIKVPEQLSLLCFCDEYAASILSPKLSFIDICSMKLGEKAAELLLDRIERKHVFIENEYVIKERLVLRSSTAKI
ncbi:MAG: putative HTH-type transcriptional repressor ExuR [Planctomycetes bacterium ADurb.Bin401]|nr:MAG: putative HTH-type transcriptional repressor ExuR [Planctomycetes bacterium ADurb.Bin401]